MVDVYFLIMKVKKGKYASSPSSHMIQGEAGGSASNCDPRSRDEQDVDNLELHWVPGNGNNFPRGIAREGVLF